MSKHIIYCYNLTFVHSIGHFNAFNPKIEAIATGVIRRRQGYLMQELKWRTQALHGCLIIVELLFSWKSTKSVRQLCFMRIQVTL